MKPHVLNPRRASGFLAVCISLVVKSPTALQKALFSISVAFLTTCSLRCFQDEGPHRGLSSKALSPSQGAEACALTSCLTCLSDQVKEALSSDGSCFLGWPQITTKLVP